MPRLLRLTWGLAVLCTLAFGLGCAKKKTTGSAASMSTSGSTVIASAQNSQSSVKLQDADAQSTSAPPKPIPPAATSGSTTIQPPTLSGATYEAWTFSRIDIDGDGEAESGDALWDAGTGTLLVWWSDTDFLAGERIGYGGFIWVNDSSVGFILSVESGAVFACTNAGDSASDDAGCVACDAVGDCATMDLDEVYEN